MNDKSGYDPVRALSAHRAQERVAWDRYAAAAMVAMLDREGTNGADDAAGAATLADLLLAERRKRFPGPKFIRAEEDTP